MDTATHPLISADPKVMVGKPCIRGTRLPVYHVLKHLAMGMSAEEYVRQFPTASIEGVQAALSYAADLLESYGVDAARQKLAG